MKKNINFLRELGDRLNTKSVVLANKYWKYEKKELDKIRCKNEQIDDELTMRTETYLQRTTM